MEPVQAGDADPLFSSHLPNHSLNPVEKQVAKFK